MRSPTRNAARPSSWLVAAALVVAVACSGDRSSPAANPTVPTASPTTDPFAVPAVIDEAYVNRVLAALDEALGDVLRIVVRERGVGPEATTRLQSVYGNAELLNLVERGYRRFAELGFPNVRSTPGDRVTTVEKLLTRRRDCVFAEVTRDLRPQSTSEVDAVTTQWIAIAAEAHARPAYNPTGWMLIYDGFDQGVVAPRDPCAR